MTPQTRGTVPDPELQRALAAIALRDQAQMQVELAIADALKAGGSVREVAADTGISTKTVQKYGHAHGWPTDAQRAGWEAERARNDDWTARIEAATALLAHLGLDVEEPSTPEKPEP